MVQSGNVVDFVDNITGNPVAYWDPRRTDNNLDVYGVGAFKAKTISDVAKVFRGFLDLH